MGNIKLFESKSIRSVWVDVEQKWYFVVADVVLALTNSANPTDYIKKIRSSFALKQVKYKTALPIDF